MRDNVNDRRLPVGLLMGMTITTIGLELPAFAVPQQSSILVAQVACVTRKQTAVFTTVNPGDPEVLGILASSTPVALTAPLQTNPPARVQIKPRGFVTYTALDCGRQDSTGGAPTTPPTPNSACRTVRNTIDSIYVFREPSWGANPIMPVVANQLVYVTQTSGSTTTRSDENGAVWVAVDLQRTFGKNFGLSPSVGWLVSADPNGQMSTLVNGCGGR